MQRKIHNELKFVGKRCIKLHQTGFLKAHGGSY